MSSHLTPEVSERDHADGPPDAPVTLVEYGDYECSHCGTAHPIIQDMRRRFAGQLRFVFRNFPLRESHPHAEHAAECAEAAAALGGADAFWAVHDALYENQDALEDENLAAYADAAGVDGNEVLRAIEAAEFEPRIRADFNGGVRSGVNGTPTFFINGVRFDGNWMDADAFAAALTDGAHEHRPARR